MPNDPTATPIRRNGKESGMRALQLVSIAVLSIAFPIGAAAQAPPSSGPSTTAAQKQSTNGQTTATTSTTSNTNTTDNHWIASGFVSSNFANNADPASTAFGGSFGYLWKSRWGAEFDAGFTPNFE